MSLHGLSAATINFKQVFTNHKIVFCLMDTEFLFLVGFVHLPAAEILISLTFFQYETLPPINIKAAFCCQVVKNDF